MTEERKKYLASISKEERAIRKQLRQYQRKISGYKFDLKYYKNEDMPWILKEIRKKIRYHKHLVRALKRQLPAPTISLINYHCNCPKCNFFVDGENDNYCYNCGQMLR